MNISQALLFLLEIRIHICICCRFFFLNQSSIFSSIYLINADNYTHLQHILQLAVYASVCMECINYIQFSSVEDNSSTI